MLHDFLESIPQVGTVEWIGLAPASRAEIQVVEQGDAVVDLGLTGDHHSKKHPGGKRQVTFIQAEHLAAIAALCGRTSPVPPELLRRNVVLSGINVISLKDKFFQIGDAIFQGTGPCVPCSLMEENLGTGGYQAMRGHGGLTAKVIRSGTFRKNDKVHWIEDPSAL